MSRNKTIHLTSDELPTYTQKLITLNQPVSSEIIVNSTIYQDIFQTIPFLPQNFIDLLFADPPYNLNKTFNTNSFLAKSLSEYENWLEKWIVPLIPCLKKTASIYICGDWRSSTAIHRVLEKYFVIQNRITWEREKGRGATHNWKNTSEDIWFATVSKDFKFYPDRVKLKRKVIAPYTHSNGNPKDWQQSTDGNFRFTAPSNLWTDLTVPFWSMPENTEHPTQKPEKLLAKIILASSDEDDIVFDPFLGSGTTSVVAKKLKRNYIGVEKDLEYACLTEKRLLIADTNIKIQGYDNGIFLDRNFKNQ